MIDRFVSCAYFCLFCLTSEVGVLVLYAGDGETMLDFAGEHSNNAERHRAISWPSHRPKSHEWKTSCM